MHFSKKFQFYHWHLNLKVNDPIKTNKFILNYMPKFMVIKIAKINPDNSAKYIVYCVQNAEITYRRNYSGLFS